MKIEIHLRDGTILEALEMEYSQNEIFNQLSEEFVFLGEHMIATREIVRLTFPKGV